MTCHAKAWKERCLRAACAVAWMAGMASAWAAQPPERDAPGAGQGTVDESGKFTPAFVEPNVASKPPVPKDLEAFARSLVKPTPDGRWSLGRVTLDPVGRVVSIPAQVNMTEGQVEYALVTLGGKVHEALLSTDASALHVHMGLLLMGLGPKDGSRQPTRLRVEMEWRGNGPVRRVALEELVVRAKDSEEGSRGGSLACTSWDYGGSLVTEGRLAADLEGSVISLIADPAALINAPRKMPVDDRLYVANHARMPAMGLPVTLHLRRFAEGTNGSPVAPSAPQGPSSPTGSGPGSRR